MAKQNNDKKLEEKGFRANLIGQKSETTAESASHSMSLEMIRQFAELMDNKTRKTLGLNL